MKKIFVSFVMIIALAVAVSAEEFGTGAAAKVPSRLLESCYTADYAYEQIMKDFQSKNIKLKKGKDYVGNGYIVEKTRDGRDKVTIINGDVYYFFETGTTEVIENINVTVENVRVTNKNYDILHYRTIYRENGFLVSVYYYDIENDAVYFEDLIHNE